LGGVYLDIKSNLDKPLDTVLQPDDEYILVQWDNRRGEAHEGFGLHPELAHIPGGEYQTHHIIAAPGHPFSRAAIERIVKNIHSYKPWSGVGKMGVVRTTGPSAYTLAIHPLRATAKHRMATEAELGSSLSISEYEHGTVFQRHYSTLSEPVVTLPLLGRVMQKGVEALRRLKANVSR
jgi:mannosyltransferase OCH1-like enzyme